MEIGFVERAGLELENFEMKSSFEYAWLSGSHMPGHLSVSACDRFSPNYQQKEEKITAWLRVLR